MDNKTIFNIIISQKDFHLLPRDEDGYCIYDGNLMLNSYEIKTLPNKLEINGNLDCSYNHLKELPEELFIGGFLDCRNNQLSSLPDGLIVNDYLSCKYNNITTEIKSQIGGSIYMDAKQEKQYIRANKIDKIKSLIDG